MRFLTAILKAHLLRRLLGAIFGGGRSQTRGRGRGRRGGLGSMAAMGAARSMRQGSSRGRSLQRVPARGRSGAPRSSGRGGTARGGRF